MTEHRVNKSKLNKESWTTGINLWKWWRSATFVQKSVQDENDEPTEKSKSYYWSKAHCQCGINQADQSFKKLLPDFSNVRCTLDRDWNIAKQGCATTKWSYTWIENWCKLHEITSPRHPPIYSYDQNVTDLLAGSWNAAISQAWRSVYDKNLNKISLMGP